MKKLLYLVVLLGLFVACGDAPSGPMGAVGTAEGPCEDYSRWREIPSPFEGERCFLYSHSADQSGVVCKRAEAIYLKTCADPKKRPDRPDPTATTPPPADP